MSKWLLLQMSPSFTLLGVVLMLVLLYLFSSAPGTGKEPPGPRPLPLLGNLLQLDLKQLHVSLFELSKIYGPVFTVYLGPKKVVVLAGYKTVKQALVNNAEEFGHREIPTIYRDVSNEHGVVFANGNSWKDLRRFCLTTLRDFGMGKRGSEEKIMEESQCLIKLFEKYKGVVFANGNSWKDLRRFCLTTLRDFGMGKRGSEEKIMEESQCLIKLFEKYKGKPFDTQQPLNYATANIICAIMYGSRFDYSDPVFKEMVEKVNQNMHLAGSAELQVYNMFPWLRWCCGRWLKNRTQYMKNSVNHTEKIVELVQGMRDTLNPKDLRGFVDSFLVRQQEELDQPGSFNNDNLKYTISDLFFAGTDTTGTTLRWALLLMAKYPHIQAQVQEELSQIIGGRKPRVEDRKNLPYTNAVIHETQRLADIGPMSLPHTASCDVTFQGHLIRKGTMVIPLLTSVLHDEEEWETPYIFNPGHFLDERGSFLKRDAFMPFSTGRRACLGESLARMELFLFFTFLLQRFRFTPPPGVSEDELDLTPSVGLTLNPSPHQLCAVSRV